MNRVVYHISNSSLLNKYFTYDLKNAVGTLERYNRVSGFGEVVRTYPLQIKLKSH